MVAPFTVQPAHSRGCALRARLAATPWTTRRLPGGAPSARQATQNPAASESPAATRVSTTSAAGATSDVSALQLDSAEGDLPSGRSIRLRHQDHAVTA
jgi:hypothetical protein